MGSIIVSKSEGKEDCKNISKNEGKTGEKGGVFLHCENNYSTIGFREKRASSTEDGSPMI